jgi:DNA gyrase subunit B
VTEEFDESRLRNGKIIVMTDADVDGSHIRTLLLTLFYRKMPELIARGFIFVAQPPLYLIKKGKQQRYVISDQQMQQALIEFGLGSTRMFVVRSGEERELGRAELDRLVTLITKVQTFEKQLPIEGEVPFASWLAEARVPEMDLPGYWVIEGEDRGFVDTRAQLDARLERIRAEKGSIKVYEGPESGCGREEADIEVHALHAGEHLQPLLIELLQAGFTPDCFSGAEGLSFRIETGKDTQEVGTLHEAFAALQKECKKDVDIQRYKGLGEMQASQLYESTMDPARRILYRVTINDAVEADRIFTVLMGPNVEPRREFIEKHALEVTNLDI